jgi:hypothetical protein
LEWLEPWCPLAAGDPVAAAFEIEMRAEVGPSHPLFGVPVAAVGRHNGCDDVLFQILDASGRVAVVHLSWVRHQEPLPWPITRFFDGLEAFASLRMSPDHDDCEE